jgi:hypothetical protein
VLRVPLPRSPIRTTFVRAWARTVRLGRSTTIVAPKPATRVRRLTRASWIGANASSYAISPDRQHPPRSPDSNGVEWPGRAWFPEGVEPLSRGSIMWTPATRRQHCRDHLRSETDLSDAEWALIEPLTPAPSRHGRPRAWPLREIVNAIFYVLRGGVAWRLGRVCRPSAQVGGGEVLLLDQSKPSAMEGPRRDARLPWSPPLCRFRNAPHSPIGPSLTFGPDSEANSRRTGCSNCQPVSLPVKLRRRLW